MNLKKYSHLLAAQACLILLVNFGSAPKVLGGGSTVWELDAPSIAALTEIIPSAEMEFDLRFNALTPQLLAMSPGDIIEIPQIALVFPTGHSGPVIAKSVSPTEVVVTTKADHFPGAIEPSDINATFIETAAPPDPGDPMHECEVTVQGFDSDQNVTPDAGTAADTCVGNNGGERAFRMTLAEGVEINGVLTLAPFELDASVTFEQFEITGFQVNNRSRISFTGEISAEFDHVLDDEPITLGTIPVVTYQLNVAQVGTVNIALVAEVFVGSSGTIHAGAKAGISTTAEVFFGLNWDDSGDPPRIFAQQGEADLQLSPPELSDDTGADVTLYGGAKLTLETDVTYGGFLPIAGTNLILTARGEVNLLVDPGADPDPWWVISGKPQVFLDVAPQLLFASLNDYNFLIIDPDPETFFTSQNEFPFNAAATNQRGPADRVSGDAIRWSRAYQADTSVTTNDLAPTSDGGAIAVGDDLQDGVVIKTDFQGNREWQRRFEGNFIPQTAKELDSGGYVLAGTTGSRLWVLRLDANGNRIWSKDITIDEGQLEDVTVAKAAGSILLGGEILTDAPALDFSPYAMELDLNGNITWARMYGQGAVKEEILGMIATVDGGSILVGETDHTPVGPLIPGSNAYTLRLSPTGDVYWSQVWASSNTDRLIAVTLTDDGGYLAGGLTDGTSLDAAPRGLLIRYPDDSVMPPVEPDWITAIGPSVDIGVSQWDEIHAVQRTRGGFVVAGNSLLSENRKTWVAKITERGGDPDLVWSAFHDGSDVENIASMHDVGDGLLLGGDSKSFGPGLPGEGSSIWISRLPYDGYMHWNTAAQAVGDYTQMVEDMPPSYPSIAGNLNNTATQDTTNLEQQVDLTTINVESTTLFIRVAGYPQVELVRDPLPPSDGDSDGVLDDVDNCTLIANPTQVDANEDGFGNACDPDLDNSGVVNFLDVSIFAAAFMSTDPDADFNGDGVVNFIDYAIFPGYIFGPPGPSGIAQ